jgi:hypothetical protein
MKGKMRTSPVFKKGSKKREGVEERGRNDPNFVCTYE